MSQKTVLVIDDESVLRDMMGRILEQAGYRVLRAPNGESGLELIEDQRPEVVLLDLNMPGMGGLSLLRRLKEQGIEQKVVLVSGSIDAKSHREAAALGANDYVRKPFFVSELLSAVEKLVC